MTLQVFLQKRGEFLRRAADSFEVERCEAPLVSRICTMRCTASSHLRRG
jgi:hypothetical protein